MPKSKNTSKSGEANTVAWRTPVKLPQTASREPIKSLYDQSSLVGANSKIATEVVEPAAVAETVATVQNRSQEKPQSALETAKNKPDTQIPAIQKQQKSVVKSVETSDTNSEAKTARRGEAEFLRLLKTERMDFYSLAEILRGSSMALYCALYSESLAKGESRCQIRQTDLMMRAGINNPATLYKQERWLTALGLISKSVRLGNHNGASYDVEPLEILPLPQFILAQFDGYLSEFTN